MSSCCGSFTGAPRDSHVAPDFGIDIGGTNIKIGLVDRSGRVVARRRLATRAALGPKQALERIAAAVAALRRGRRIGSIGVGIAGLVDHKRGIVRTPPNLPGWHGTPVKNDLEELTGLRVSCANDVNAVALGEWLHGAGRGCQDLFCLTLGTGVGGGVVAGGRLLLGANHAAGELGHTVIFGDGPTCRCGARGCLERYVGAEYVVQRARRRVRAQLSRLTSHRNQTVLFGGSRPETPSVLTALSGHDLARLSAKDIGRAARAGDRIALDVVKETGHYLGLGLANVVALFDPARIVIGGGVSRLGGPLLEAVRRTVLSRIPVFEERQLAFVFAELGDDAGVVGASRLGDWLPA